MGVSLLGYDKILSIITGIFVGPLFGVLWYRFSLRRKSAEARLLEQGQQRLEASFRVWLRKSDLLWLLAGAFPSLLSGIIVGAKSGQLASAVIVGSMAYLTLFVAGIVSCHFYSRRQYVEGHLSQISIKLPEEDVALFKPRLRAAFLTYGDYFPLDITKSVNARLRTLKLKREMKDLQERVAKMNERLRGEQKSGNEKASALLAQYAAANELNKRLLTVLGFVITAAQDVALLFVRGKPSPAPAKLIQRIRALLECLVDVLGGGEQCRACFYTFRDPKADGYAFISYPEDDWRPRPKISPDEVGIPPFGPIEAAVRTEDGWQPPYWIGVPYLHGSGETLAGEPYGAIRVEMRQGIPMAAVAGELIPMFASLLEPLRASSNVSAKVIHEQAKERYLVAGIQND